MRKIIILSFFLIFFSASFGQSSSIKTYYIETINLSADFSSRIIDTSIAYNMKSGPMIINIKDSAIINEEHGFFSGSIHVFKKLPETNTENGAIKVKITNHLNLIFGNFLLNISNLKMVNGIE